MCMCLLKNLLNEFTICKNFTRRRTIITNKPNFQCKLTKVTRKEDLDYQEEVNYEKLFRE